ncbi:hypothetical protein IFM89_020353, partial [Coptis chinensis]
MRKASSTTNIVDDLTSIFGGNLVDFTLSLVPVLRHLENSRTLRGKLKKDEERDWIATNVHRSARFLWSLIPRAKALAKKNECDRQTRERSTLRDIGLERQSDLEIKRWSAGKQGNFMGSTLNIAI